MPLVLFTSRMRLLFVMNTVSGFFHVPNRDSEAMSVSTFAIMLQMGSQFRSKAEPAGVVNGNEWIPAKNVTRTLAGTPSGPYCRNLDDPPAEAAAPAK